MTERTIAFRVAEFLAAAPAKISQPPDDSEYRRMIGKTREDMAKLVHKLEAGEIDLDQFGADFDAILLDGHTKSWVLGRQRAGDLRKPIDADKLAGLAAKDSQGPFLNQFLDDIRNGRYDLEDGSLNAAAIQARANLYSGVMRGTANEAFVEASDPTEDFDWFLGGEDNCEDCPRISALSPFTKDTLIGYPGDGDTQCLGNCNCHLTRHSDGMTGFARVD